jgi:pimeloyl-ACP methyl ester carboxylesterase
MAAKQETKRGLEHHTLQTQDGSTLSFYSIGHGPGLLILHGSMNYALGSLELAELLAEDYTLYLLSRRGRGLSGPYPKSVNDLKAVLSTTEFIDDGGSKGEGIMTVGGKTYQRTYHPSFTSSVLSTELSDLNLAIEATGAEFMLGISSGAILSMEACLSAPASLPKFHSTVKKVVIFEPPLQFSDLDTGVDMNGVKRYEDAMSKGDVSGALVDAMKAVQLGPGWIPRPVMKILTNLMLWGQSRKSKDGKSGEEEERGKTGFGDFAPLLRYDFALVENVVGLSQRFECVAREKKILLLSGEKSPSYIHIGMRELERVVKGAESVKLEGVGHEVLCNAEMRGSPAKAIDALRKFFD